MADFIEIYNVYITESVQILFGFYFLTRLLHQRVRFYFYFLFTGCASAVVHAVQSETMAEFGAFLLLLVAGGIFICHTDWKSSVLYAALVVEIMQLSYGILNSLLSALYPFMSGFDQNMVGIVFMLSGDFVSLLLTGVFCFLVYRYFSYFDTIEKQHVYLVLIPILMIFIMDEYINSFIYGMVVTDESGVTVYSNHYQMFVIQLLGIASLFCILYTYKKLLQSFRLSTELSLLEQEEHSLNQYVEEAKTSYEKTKSFRHDIKNHIMVLKELLQNDRPRQALHYIEDMEKIAEELSFPCSTNNPVVDILAGNKLGMAKSMGIDTDCSLLLPYPCGLRDIDICIILSNADRKSVV